MSTNFSFIARCEDTIITPEKTLLILTYEVCSVLHATLEKREEFAESELADCASMLRLFCELERIDFNGKEMMNISDDVTIHPRTLSGAVHQLIILHGKLVQAFHYRDMFGPKSGK